MLARRHIARPKAAWNRAPARAGSGLPRPRGRDALGIPAQARRELGPVEAGARVDLASGGHVLVSDDVANPTNMVDRGQQFLERGVFRRLARAAFETLELHADRPVVGLRAAVPARTPRMPRALVDRDELQDRAVAPHHEVGGDLEPADRLVIGMRRP